MKTFTLANLVVLTASLMVVCGCSTITVTTDYDPSAPFGTYRTYAVEPPANVPPLSPTLDSALRGALQENLAARGIREVTMGENPDLAVVPHTRLQQRYSVQQYTQWGYAPGVWPYWGGSYRVWAGAPVTYSTINSYTEGTLILDFVDTSKQRLVFRGTGTAIVSRNIASNAERIREAVKKIVARLPPAT